MYNAKFFYLPNFSNSMMPCLRRTPVHFDYNSAMPVMLINSSKYKTGGVLYLLSILFWSIRICNNPNTIQKRNCTRITLFACTNCM